MGRPERVAVLGGCGHVGLPLALLLANKGCEVLIVDRDALAVESLKRGVIGFREDGAEELLRSLLGRNLHATTDAARVADVETIICVVGTPIDEHLNPRVEMLKDVVGSLAPHMRSGQLFVLRSTVYPGATIHVARWLEAAMPNIDVAFCPERVAQGHVLEELGGLPQIVSGVTPRAAERARALFDRIAPKTIQLTTTEAELAKLFCNAWRYITFAAANQFYTLCAQVDIDYYRIHAAVTDSYPRMRSLPGAGFAAGPCLFKDTMQLAAFYNNEFSLGQSAMLVNEGLPRVMMEQLRELSLAGKTAGILGMAFKGENDDTRESLAFKMKKLLALECKSVLCTDEYVKADWLVPVETVLAEADFLVIGAPHRRYRALRPSQPVLDPWNHLQRGGLLR